MQAIVKPLLPYLVLTLLTLVAACQPTLTQQPALSSPLVPLGDDLSDELYNSEQPDTFSEICNRAEQSLQQSFAELQQPQTLGRNPVNGTRYLEQLDNFFIALENTYSVAQLYENTHPDESMRASASQCQKSIESLFTDVNLSKPLYENLRQVRVQRSDKAGKRYAKKLLQNLTRSGVDKDEATREQVRQLNIEIADLGQQFSRNIREDVRQILISDRSELDGLPQDYIDGLARDEQGQWIITTDYPSVFPYLRYAEADQRRLDIYRKFLDRGYPANEPVLADMIEKRDQLAKLLGHPNYAAFVTENAMIETPENAAAFIDRIAELALPRANRDYGQLLAQLQQDQPDATRVGNWQKAFLEERVKKQQYQYDAKQVREYFSYSQVKQGIFDLVSALFDVRIRDWDTSVWHPAVTAHQLISANADGSEEILGYFYLDMHPRAGKYKHAAHFGMKTGVLDKQKPVSALICNFPGGDTQRDSSGMLVNRGLMEHGQVETFLHEFGHLMHSLLGGHQRWSGLSGIATERDFVEAPSQLLEEWVWDYDTLKTFAVDADGNTISPELVDKMRAARGFGKGTHIRNQMFYAALSLQYYSTPPEQLDLTETLIALQSQYSPFDYIDETHFYANFGHLYGYSARYYTYMWSLVIAADMFGEFEREGLRNKEVAQRYRQTVLAPGGAKDAADLVGDFLGRPFNYDAFIDELNSE